MYEETNMDVIFVASSQHQCIAAVTAHFATASLVRAIQRTADQLREIPFIIHYTHFNMKMKAMDAVQTYDPHCIPSHPVIHMRNRYYVAINVRENQTIPIFLLTRNSHHPDPLYGET
jgi:hypothetical protein